MNHMPVHPLVLRSALILVLSLVALGAGQSQLPPAGQVAEVRKYIKTAWSTLSRSNRDLPAAAKDPKVVDLVKQRGLKPFAEFGKTLTAKIRTHTDENRQLIRETAADGGR